MPLALGTRLGVYQVTAQIGAGGMGEVYRATDSNLKRSVAIKVLPASVAGDADRLARFQREAEVLGALNHPNIGAIYGLEKTTDFTALVMELVEGDDLSQRIARGAIPIDEALPMAKQIADALAAAHEQGIIHRDLKPANIRVRSDGTVKVLDFGLAKAMDAGSSGAGGSGGLSMSPTMMSPAQMSGIGVILGTAAYMAPEQARGRAVDKRADIWAFGVVLYEMLAGARLFQGEDVTETLASVVKEQPDISKAPWRVQRLLRRCLEKDPRKRLRDIGDAWDLLDDDAQPPAASDAARRREWIAWSVASVLAIALAGVALIYVRQAPASTGRRTHLFVPLPANGITGFFALSPDGRAVVMTYQSKLAVYSMESGETRSLSGTDGARGPFWSPDGRTIAFFSISERKFKTVAASGGVPQVLCDDVAADGGGSWNRRGTILFSAAGVLRRVAASGGPCAELAKSEPGTIRRHPIFLPDGDHFLYRQAGPDEARTGVFVASLNAPEGKRLLADDSSALFAPDAPASSRGRLLFVREQTLMAQPFDAASLALSGEPVPVANHVTVTNNNQMAASVSDDGTLMYLTNTRVERQMVWYDRAGAAVGRAAATGIQPAAVSLSADGKQIAFSRRDANGRVSLWLEDLERHQQARFTNPPLSPGAAVWSPDGQRLAFVATPTAQEHGIYVKSVNGGTEQILLRGGTNPSSVSDWSRDGRWIVYTETDPKTGADIWLSSATGNSTAAKPIPLVRTPADESLAQLSPDGKWLAYTSNESNAFGQVLLRPFNGGAPLGEAKWHVSASNLFGREPRWRADSKELFYLETPETATQRNRVMAVPIGVAPAPVGSPKFLFEFASVGTVPALNLFMYAPSADGQRFLVDTFATDAQPTLEAILNWAGSKDSR